MPSIGIYIVPRKCIPDFYQAISTARGNALAVGGPGHAEDVGSVAGVGVDVLDGGNFPDFHSEASATDGEVGSIRGPGHAMYDAAVEAVVGDVGSAVGIHYTDIAVSAN